MILFSIKCYQRYKLSFIHPRQQNMFAYTEEDCQQLLKSF